MSYELDMSQYLDLFLTEAQEQLEILEQETLKLEKEPSQERLQVIFRAAHTLKGSARAMGFQHFAELTHEMENLLDNLRNGTVSVNTEIADALLSCLDSLNKMIELIGNGAGDNLDVSALVARIAACNSGTSAPPTTPAAPSAATQEFSSQLTADQRGMIDEAAAQDVVWHASFRLEDDCAMKYVRAFMAISEIQKHGELLVTVPHPEALEEEQFEHEFELVFQTQEPIEDLKKRLTSISEVAWHSVQAWATKPASVEEKPTAAAPVAAAPTEPVASAAKKSGESGQTVRVDVSRLDTLMNLVGELVIDRTRIAQIGSELGAKYNDDNVDALSETVGHIHRITSDLQDQIMKARMMPIESVFNRFPRVVRDLAQKLGKEIKLEMSGGETELDRSVIEVIGDPLLHILRNSIDHGVELPADRARAGKPATGTVHLTARHQENHIHIEIIDDGRGIDAERVKNKAVQTGFITREVADRMTEKEALQLIFSSGLSTAVEVSEVSGRGVGMDIVRSNIQKLGGIIDLETNLGQGTKFTLRLPLTLAIIRGLLVNVTDTVYVIPLGSVIETMLIERKSIQTVNRREVIVIRGLTTPLVHVGEVFNRKKAPTESGANDQIYVVIVGLAEQRIGLVVDNLIGEREVVIKSLSRFCGDVAGISGATILGDGNVALIMDVNGIVSQQRAA